MAPELLDPPQFGFMHGDPSKESDVYSLAMTVYMVCYFHFVPRVANRPSWTDPLSQVAYRKGAEIYCL